jgi:uncharacterized protein (DUF2252 family)
MSARMTLGERRARGTDARTRTPRAAHDGWPPAAGRPDPVALLVSQEADREPDLVPVRHGRMLLSPFTFYRGAAKIMAEDLKGTPALLQGRDQTDPLFLQVKEATPSVLEAHLPRSRYRQHGQRVVQGQWLMQAVSDIFLGWTRGVDVSRHFYWRQLRDMKGSVDTTGITPLGLSLYARLCGWSMARAHARSGDPVAVAAYLKDGRLTAVEGV